MTTNNNNKGDTPLPSKSTPSGSGSGNTDFLPEDLLWADGGHASDIVLTALADGERTIIPNVVRIHVEHCTACTSHLGNAVLLSLHTDRQFAIKTEYERALETIKLPLPRLAIALGLAVAALGIVPSLLDDVDASAVRVFVTQKVPLFLRGLGTLVHRLDESGAGLFATYAAAAMLVVMGIAAVRLLPKKETSR